MGQFSWLCAVSGEALIEKHSDILNESEHSAYLVTPNATYFEECYEGYGVFGGKDVYELLGDGDRDEGLDLYYEGKAPFEVKVVLADYYKGQTYDELEESPIDPNQGWKSSRLEEEEFEEEEEYYEEEYYEEGED